jgi:hypothetical protein
MSDLLVPARFCGPPSSGNGGWTSGAMAELVHDHLGHQRGDHAEPWPAITVTLRRPPPLDTPVPATESDGVVVAADEAGTVAEAGRAAVALSEVEAVGADPARRAEASYAGWQSHPFPTCFTCGPDRAEGDGLRIFPGPVEDLDGSRRVAATWVPHPSTAEDWHTYHDDQRRASIPVTWAALDCTGGWASDLAVNPSVLGRMTARLDALPVVGEEHVLVGHYRGREGRKTFTASTLYDSDGRVVATAEHTWIQVDPTKFP